MAFLVLIFSLLATYAIAAVLALFTGWLWQLCWNCFAVPVLHMPSLTYWQAFACMYMIAIVVQKTHGITLKAKA